MFCCIEKMECRTLVEYTQLYINIHTCVAHRLGPKEAHHTHDVLTTNWAFVQHLAALGARRHVAALQHHAFDRCVHADLAQIVAGQLIDGCGWINRVVRSGDGLRISSGLPGAALRSFHSRFTRSSSSFFSQQPL